MLGRQKPPVTSLPEPESCRGSEEAAQSRTPTFTLTSQHKASPRYWPTPQHRPTLQHRAAGSDDGKERCLALVPLTRETEGGVSEKDQHIGTVEHTPRKVGISVTRVLGVGDILDNVYSGDIQDFHSLSLKETTFSKNIIGDRCLSAKWDLNSSKHQREQSRFCKLETDPSSSCSSNLPGASGMYCAHIVGSKIEHRSHTNQDLNNNLSKSSEISRSKERNNKYLHGNSKVNLVKETASVKLPGLFRCRLWKDDLMGQNCPTPPVTVNKVVAKVKNFFKKVKHSGRRQKIKFNKYYNSSAIHLNAVEGGSSHRVRETKVQGGGGARQDSEGGQKRGDHNSYSRGRPWWASRGTQDRSQCNAQHGDDQPSAHSHSLADVSSVSNQRRSFDTDNIGRRKRTRVPQKMRRSTSIEQDRSDNVFINMYKFRDKQASRRSRLELSSSSEDPYAGAVTRLKPRSSKSSDRKRSSPNQREGSENTRSRRRQTKKAEKSSSSLSSSSSRSASLTRTRPTSGLPSSVYDRSQSYKTSSEPVSAEPLESLEGNSKDNTNEFLQRLDSVLTDLVENEKKKISSYGHHIAKQTSCEAKPSSIPEQRKCHKYKKQSKKSDQATCGEEMSPAMQQLRATLKTVRVRKRVPPASDVIDKHSQLFTPHQLYNPRILRSQRASHLITQRCYQPPRRKWSKPHENANDYPSDFCSSDDDRPGARQTVPAMVDGLKQETEPGSSHKEEEDDTCYGSDYPGSQAPPPRRITQDSVHLTQRLAEAVDSGEYSIDSAYTGSRGATPESILYSGIKPRRQGGSLTTPPLTAQPYQTRPARSLPQAERLQQFKKKILNEIRENSLYSDESINSLLEQHRHRSCNISTAELDLVSKSIQEDLGVKPKHTQHLYHILVGADDEHPQAEEIKRLGEAEDTSLLTLQSTGKTYKYQRRRDTGAPGQPSNSSHPTHTSTHQLPVKPPRNIVSLPNQEAEDEAWARSVVADVAPHLMTEAKEEVQQRPEDLTDSDWSSSVTELCQQFQIKI